MVIYLRRDSNKSFSISRHVLQEMTVDTFVPNDTKIENDGNGIIHLIVIFNYGLAQFRNITIPIFAY